MIDKEEKIRMPNRDDGKRSYTPPPPPKTPPLVITPSPPPTPPPVTTPSPPIAPQRPK